MININKAECIRAMNTQWAHVTSYTPQDFWWNKANYIKGFHAQGETVRVVKNFIRRVNHDQHNLS
jgi:hypothetical protein